MLIIRQRWEQRVWTKRGEGAFGARAVRSPLWMLSGLYRAGLAARSALYARGWLTRTRAPAKVIVAGNLTVGGTGKTPLACWIARQLSLRGLKTAVILRGYKGAAGKGPLVVSEGGGALLAAAVAGDEAVLLAKKLAGVPVVAGKDRAAAARLAIARFGSSHLVLDDGFQHWPLERDMDILVMNGQQDPEREYLLPRGPLREPITAAARAHALVITGAPEDGKPGFAWMDRICPDLPVFATSYRPLGLSSIRGGKISPMGLPSLAFCGIGFPEGFFSSLENSGVPVVAKLAFPDHHRYTALDLLKLAAKAREQGAKRLVTTEKDAVKIADGWGDDFPVDVLRVELDFRGGEGRFLDLILSLAGEDGDAA